MPLPPYRELGGGQIYRQPFLLNGTIVQSFALAADLSALQRTVDKSLNLSPDQSIVYKPLLPFVLLAVADIASVSSADPPDSLKGWQPEVDVAFWVPIGGGKMKGDKLEISSLGWFLPYVYVDSPSTMVTGREVYGFNKALGRFTLPPRGSIGDVTASTLVLDPYAPTTQMTWKTVVSIDAPGTEPFPLPAPEHTSPESFVKAVFAALTGRDDGTVEDPTFRLMLNVFDYLATMEVPVVFLKQFRDAESPDLACYQSVVVANQKVTKFRGGGFLPSGYQITVTSYDSQPIATDLGLAAGTLTPFAAFHSDFDFILPAGKVVP